MEKETKKEVEEQEDLHGLNESVTGDKISQPDDLYLIGRGDPNLSPDAGKRLI